MKLFHFLCIVLVLPVFLVSCEEDDDEPDNNNSITADYYFSATIDGTPTVIEDGKSNFTNFSGGFGGSTASGWQSAPFTMFATFSDFINGTYDNPYYGVAFTKGYLSDPNDFDLYKGIISVRSYSFGELSRSTNDSGGNGVVVFMYDTNTVEWATDLGTADQSGSSFAVTEYIDIVDGVAYKAVKANFTCTLYDGNGNSKVITGGKVSGKIITW